MRLVLFLLVLSALLLGGAGWASAQNPERVVLIETDYGNITLKLYNETPLHRDNFLKLVQNKTFDTLLFHRVINTFMIQGGIPDKGPDYEKSIAGGPLDYTIPAEFNPKLFHKPGALAAGRESDDDNPEQASSCCQFYIVQGKVFSDSVLHEKALRITRMKAYNMMIRHKENRALVKKYNTYLAEGNVDSIKATKAHIDKLTEAEMKKMPLYKFSEEQRKAYTTTGGAPHLDGSYTVFGEVLEGMDVVDKIATAPRDKADRPLRDIHMKISIIK